MQYVRRFAAIVCIVLLVIILPLSLLIVNLGRFISNPERVKQAAIQQIVHSDLVPIALEWFSDRRAQERVEKGEALTDIEEPNIVLLMSTLDREDWKLIKDEVLPDEVLENWIASTIDDFYAWVDSGDVMPHITWDLAPFKEEINSEAGRNSIVIAYDNLNPCTDEEIADFLGRLEIAPPGTEVLYNLCEFPDPWHSDQFGDYVKSLEDLVRNVPDEFILTDELTRASVLSLKQPERIKQWLRAIRRIANLIWLAPILLLLLVLVFAVRSVRDLARWWGAALVSAGSFTIILALLRRPLLPKAFGPLFVDMSQPVQDEVVRVIQAIAAETFRPLLIQSIVISFIGLALLVWWFAPKKAEA